MQPLQALVVSADLLGMGPRSVIVCVLVALVATSSCGAVKPTDAAVSPPAPTAPSTPSELGGEPTRPAPEVGTSDELPLGDHVAVGSITDGDTFRTDDGTRIRIIGVDTPERGDCYFSEATAHLAAMIPVGTSVRLVYDVERTDRYGRTLAYVYRSSDGLFVNVAMASDGFALQMTIPPNVAHAEQLRAAVAEAREAGRGLWSSCDAAAATPLVSRSPSAPRTLGPWRWS